MGTLVDNERSNFKLLLQRVSLLGGVPVLITPGDMSNTIPDEKVTATFIGYLSVRLLDLSREIKAARVIQLAWRKFYAIRKEEQLKVFTSAALVLQKHIRIFLKKRQLEKFTQATIVLQKYARVFLAKKELKRLKWLEEARKRSCSVLIIQNWWRSVLIRKKYLKMITAILTIQSFFRGYQSRQQLAEQNQAAQVIQRRWRIILRSRDEKRLASIRLKATITLQSHLRC